jgi:RimK family alpha-L-glutamate ligase
MNRLFVLNSNSRWKKDGEAIAESYGYSIELIKTYQTILHIHKNSKKISWVYNNSEIELSSRDKFFLRLRGGDDHFTSILWSLFKFRGYGIHDEIQAEHTNANEKISQMTKLAETGIRIPESIICTSRSFEANESYICEHITYPCVVKEDGSRGKNVKIIPDYNQLKEFAVNSSSVFLIQEWIENAFDIRVLMFDDSILGAIKRSRKKGYLNNVSQGVIPSEYVLSEEQKKICLDAAKLVGVTFAGVDIFEDGTVIEVNCGPQFKGFESVHGKRVVSDVIQLLFKR